MRSWTLARQLDRGNDRRPGAELRQVRFNCEGSFDEVLDQVGSTPLPPYIKRPEGVQKRIASAIRPFIRKTSRRHRCSDSRPAFHARSARRIREKSLDWQRSLFTSATERSNLFASTMWTNIPSAANISRSPKQLRKRSTTREQTAAGSSPSGPQPCAHSNRRRTDTESCARRAWPN